MSWSGEGGIPGRALACLDAWRTATGAGLPRAPTDALERKRGERSGLETPVVHALIDRKWKCA